MAERLGEECWLLRGSAFTQEECFPEALVGALGLPDDATDGEIFEDWNVQEALDFLAGLAGE
jgi:hypothetical protein